MTMRLYGQEFDNDGALDAITAFWNGFGVPAFMRGQVPKNQKPPFITFTYNRSPYAKSLETAYIVTYGATALTLDRLTGLVMRALPGEGLLLTLPGGQGALWMTRGQPFIAMYGSEDEMEKARMVNYCVTAYTAA